MMRSDKLMNVFCRTALVLVTIATGAVTSALAQGYDRVEQQDRDRTRRADIRASVSDFVRIQSDSEQTRASLSDEERLEMRRQIDEAIRKAYGRRSRN